MVMIVSQIAFSKEEISFVEVWYEPYPATFRAARALGTSLSAIRSERAKMRIEHMKTMPIRIIGESLKRHLIA